MLSAKGAKPGRILRTLMVGGSSTGGYQNVMLQRSGRTERRYVHHLVAEAFICESPNGRQINHKDGNKENNTPENLEWVTPSENIQHARKLGLLLVGESVRHAKLTEADVVNIKEACRKGETQRAIAKRFRVSQGQISRINLGHEWKHVS